MGIATPQNFILKFGEHSYVWDITPRANFGVDWLGAGFSINT